MKWEMIASNSIEVWIMTFFVVIGVGFLLFARKGELIFAGVIALAGMTVIAYSNHSKYIGKHFLMEQFNAGSALSCGLWRGESARVDPLRGWRFEQGTGFVKGDVIINEGVCSVIGKPFPEPSTVPYWMAFVSVTGVLLMLRYAIIANPQMVAKEENHDADDDTNREPS